MLTNDRVSETSPCQQTSARDPQSQDSTCVSPTPPPGFEVSDTYILLGPGERECVVFPAHNGGSVQYLITGSGEFEIKLISASTGKRVEKLLELSDAGANTIQFSAPSFSVVIKVEGPGSWQVGITPNYHAL